MYLVSFLGLRVSVRSSNSDWETSLRWNHPEIGFTTTAAEMESTKCHAISGSDATKIGIGLSVNMTLMMKPKSAVVAYLAPPVLVEF